MLELSIKAPDNVPPDMDSVLSVSTLTVTSPATTESEVTEKALRLPLLRVAPPPSLRALAVRYCKPINDPSSRVAVPSVNREPDTAPLLLTLDPLIVIAETVPLLLILEALTTLDTDND